MVVHLIYALYDDASCSSRSLAGSQVTVCHRQSAESPRASCTRGTTRAKVRVDTIIHAGALSVWSLIAHAALTRPVRQIIGRTLDQTHASGIWIKSARGAYTGTSQVRMIYGVSLGAFTRFAFPQMCVLLHTYAGTQILYNIISKGACGKFNVYGSSSRTSSTFNPLMCPMALTKKLVHMSPPTLPPSGHAISSYIIVESSYLDGNIIIGIL